MASKLSAGEEKTCPRCQWTGPANAKGRWDCRNCARERGRLRNRIGKLPPRDVRQCARCGWSGPPPPKGHWRCRSCRNLSRRAVGKPLSPEALAARRERDRQRAKQRAAWLRAGDVTDEELRMIWERDQGRCRYCGTPIIRPQFTRCSPRGFDHVIPMARGGHHTADNIVVCCLPCNVQKGAS